jgi:hypothetical protein
MRRVILLIVVLLAGCTQGSYVEGTSVDYNFTVEAATNNDLVANVLRARDYVPLYFTDVSQIRGSLTQAAAAQVTWPIGPIGKSTSRGSVQAGALSISENPSFDFAPLNTKNFTAGMLQQASMNEVGHYIIRGLPPEMVLDLFVSQIDKMTIQKQADGSTKIVGNVDHLKYADVLAEIYKWTNCQHCVEVRINVVKSSSESLPPISAKSFQNPFFLYAAAQAEASGMKVEQQGDQYRLVKSSSQTVLCVPSDKDSSQYMALGLAIGSVVSGANLQLPESDTDCTLVSMGPAKQSKKAAASPPLRTVIVVHFRSPQAVFYYLGSELVLNQTEYVYKRSEKFPDQDQKCQTFKYDLIKPPYPWCHQFKAPFFIQTAEEFEARRATLLPQCAAEYQPEIEINYRGRKYYVSNAQCARDPTTVTLQILGDLLNLHRDASEIPTTKTVVTQ